GCVRLEFGKAHEVVCGFHLRFGGIDLRLRSLQCLLCLVVICARGPALLKQSILPLEMVAGLRQLTLRSNEVGLRCTQRVALVLRFLSCYHLAGLDPIAELAVVFKHPTRDTKCKCYLVLSFDPAGQSGRRAGFALLDRRGPNWARLRRGGLRLWRARRKRHKS